MIWVKKRKKIPLEKYDIIQQKSLKTEKSKPIKQLVEANL